jgi:2-phosphoglycerate kinase
MTKAEERLIRFETLFTSFIEANNEHKAYLKESIESLHKKIDDGHMTQDKQIRKIHDELFDDVRGIRTRVFSLEDTRKTLNKGITFVSVLTAIGGLVVEFWDNIIRFLKTA